MVTRTEEEVYEAIKIYADAYSLLQHCQENHADIIPSGDQKTGCIGEFYALMWLRHHRHNLSFRLAASNMKGWDIGGFNGKQLSVKIQVKTVSAYSKNRVMSRIHPGWNEMIVLFLNRQLWPEGFWLIDNASFLGTAKYRVGMRCPDPTGRAPGSGNIAFGKNRNAEILEAMAASRDT